MCQPQWAYADIFSQEGTNLRKGNRTIDSTIHIRGSQELSYNFLIFSYFHSLFFSRLFFSFLLLFSRPKLSFCVPHGPGGALSLCTVGRVMRGRCGVTAVVFLLAFQTASALGIQVSLLELPLVVLVHRALDGKDGIEERAILRCAVLPSDYRWLCADELPVLRLPHILCHRAGAYTHRPTNRFVAGIAR